MSNVSGDCWEDWIRSFNFHAIDEEEGAMTSKVRDYKPIRELSGYILETDSQDIAATLETIGHPAGDIGLLLIKLDESGTDYTEVWQYQHLVPYLYHECKRIA